MMCYLDIEPTKTRRKIFYRFMVKTNDKNIYRSIYVKKYYLKGKEFIAENVKNIENVKKTDIKDRHTHSYLKKFKGWGVFETIEEATEVQIAHFMVNTIIVKVRCEGAARKAIETFTGSPCLIFDKMIILGEVK